MPGAVLAAGTRSSPAPCYEDAAADTCCPIQSAAFWPAAPPSRCPQRPSSSRASFSSPSSAPRRPPP
eukprot:CAMPEP_0204442872 /NCGR_PEP_ID=MMETSP0470-20130426/87948_1 /ASSEMBLY_ACC=CAM_ASM_000385 /TAXON_ID=2969 /ORGANISM="Oxyrrhis marina" /LENGTH=66 /DNA_ID=CAMNT_0051442115 /DNA_START=70 /DNA_END=266 /DNA_ORIENTATION=+